MARTSREVLTDFSLMMHPVSGTPAPSRRMPEIIGMEFTSELNQYFLIYMQSKKIDNIYIGQEKEAMTYNEYFKWLKKQGVEIVDGGGRHHKKGIFNGKSVPLPYHGAKEIGRGLVKKLNKDLGL
ncbi:TPA: type II toxin-antitoxin system HicA family toxin [Salmonella enterica subsp. enterica serovar Muenchen]